jgi:hypothetical protein
VYRGMTDVARKEKPGRSRVSKYADKLRDQAAST